MLDYPGLEDGIIAIRIQTASIDMVRMGKLCVLYISLSSYKPRPYYNIKDITTGLLYHLAISYNSIKVSFFI